MTDEGPQALELLRYSIQSPVKVNWPGRKLIEEKFGFGSNFGSEAECIPLKLVNFFCRLRSNIRRDTKAKNHHLHFE